MTGKYEGERPPKGTSFSVGDSCHELTVDAMLVHSCSFFRRIFS